MIRPRGMTRPRRLAILAAAALLPVLAGCEAGANAPVLHWHQPTPGESTQAGSLAISNAFVLGPGSGALAKGQNAAFYLAIGNEGSADRLLAISAPGTAASVTLAGGSISLPSQHVALLSGPAPKIVLTGLTRSLAAGDDVHLTLTFQDAGSVRLLVPVMPQVYYYSHYSAAPTPTPTPTPAPTATPGTKGRQHRASASASPSVSPSAG